MQFARGASFRSLSVGLKTVLCALQFLFVDQLVATLDDYAIASRLSYSCGVLRPTRRYSPPPRANCVIRTFVASRSNGCWAIRGRPRLPGIFWIAGWS